MLDDRLFHSAAGAFFRCAPSAPPKAGSAGQSGGRIAEGSAGGGRFLFSPAKGAVSESEIDKFKGVMDSFNAEYGIFITTNYFTDRARKKATQGNNTVTLIDGQTLAELVEKYQLHITPVNTYALDDYYFDLK